MGPTLLLILALVAGSQAGPIQTEIFIGDQCSRQCTVSSQFNYEPGTSYEFQYDNEIRTAVQGASEDHAGLHMTAKIHLDFISKCEVIMRISDVTMKEHDPETSTMKETNAALAAILERNPIRLSFQDGRIEHICLSAEEASEIVNIKRGILSVFQNNMDDITKGQTVSENDVSGNCETEYTSAEKGWYNQLIKKSKNLLGCSGRHGYRSAIQGIPYSSQSKVQSLPLLKSTHNCEQEVVRASGRLMSAICQEKHTFAPFSRQGSGATTHNTQKLTFVKETKTRSRPVPVSTRVPLHFDHVKSTEARTTMDDLERKLMEVCETTKNGVLPETPSLFTSLVKTMKTMEARDMAAVYEKIKSKAVCAENNKMVKKFFLDAIPMTGTTSGLTLMTSLIASQEVSGVEADMWLTTLVFIQHPTVDMLTEVKPLLSMTKNVEKAMLAVSSLVHSICKNTPNCADIQEVRKILYMLDSKVGTCKVTDKNFETTLIALRAIGNTGRSAASALNTRSKLSKCIKLSSNPIEIRLSAIEALGLTSCNADKTELMNVYLNTQEDSEVRIAAYKAMMKCPTTEILRKVKVALGKEEVNQVGSYVWSHLTNLMKTSDPHKQTIRSIVEDSILQKEFDMDKRKFSRNYEGSMFFEKINTGAAIEADLIWSSKSFIPRSAMANLTVDLFGNAVNLFEIGGRLEGLEYFLEAYFGPNGHFSENDVQAVADETALQLVKADKVNRINKRMASAMDDLRGSLYMKVFGNELRYMNFQGLDSLLAKDSINFLDILMQLKDGNDYQFTQSVMFLDSSIIVPTSSGFPLNLTLNGTATVDLKASGKMDVLKLTSSPPSLDIQGEIRPSGAVVVSSVMSVDAFVTKVGIKMVSSLYSNTALKGKVSLTDGNIFSMEMDAPEKKMDVFNVKSTFFTVHRNMEREQKMITENRQEMKACSGDKLARITGLELCGEVQFPNASLVENAPYFPMTGPVNVGITLNKRDSLTSYKLEARSTHTKKENVVRVAFSTPNGKIDRSFGINFDLNKAAGTFDTSLTSPWTNADFKGAITKSRNEMGVNGKLNVDNSVRYEIKALVQSAKSGPGMMYTPTLIVRGPDMEPVQLTGAIKYAPWKLLSIDTTVEGITNAPITIKSTVLNKLKVMKLSASIASGKKSPYSVDATIQKIRLKTKVAYKPQISIRTPTAEVFAFGGNVAYATGKNIIIQGVLDKVFKKPVSIKTVLKKSEYRRGRVLYNTRLDFRSAVADIKMKTKLDNRNMKSVAADVDLTYVIRRYARDNIKFVSKVINLSTKALTKGKANMVMTSKKRPEMNFKFTGDVNHNTKHSEIDAALTYGADPMNADKRVSLSASLDRAIKSWSVASAAFKGEFLIGKTVRMVSRINHAHTKKSLDSNIMLRLNKNAISSSLTLKDQSKALMNVAAEFELSYPGRSVSVGQTVIENKVNDYTSTMNAQIGKAKHKIITSWKRESPEALTISSDMSFSGSDLIHVEGMYDFSGNMYKTSGAVSKGSSTYRFSTTSTINMGQQIEMSSEIEYPSRHIIATVKGTKTGSRYSGRTDLRWNAGRDETELITLLGYSQFLGTHDVDGSLTLQYPTRTMSANLKHTSKSKTNSHLDFQWAQDQQISIDTSFGNYDKKRSNVVFGNMKLRTPFKSLKSLNISVENQEEDSEFSTKVNVEWNPKNIISAIATVQRPLTLRSIGAEIVAKTPFKSFKNIKATLRHNVKQGVKTIGKANWNKQSAQFDLTLINNNGGRRRDMRGQLDIKSSFKTLKVASIDFSHSSSGNEFRSTASFQHNKNKYSLQNFVRHVVNGWDVNNNGENTIITPSQTIVTKWDHSNTLSEITSSIDTTWAKNKRVYIKYSGRQDLTGQTGSLSSALEIQTPFKQVRDIVFQVNHEHRPTQIDSSLKITNEGTHLAFVEGKYLREDKKVTSSFRINDILVDTEVAYKQYPLTGHLEATFGPQRTMVVDASYNKDNAGNVDGTISFVVPDVDPVTFTLQRNAQGNGYNSVAKLQYNNYKVVGLESTYRIDRTKMIDLKFVSPFTEDYTAAVTLQGTGEHFDARASIEAEPYIPKWSGTASFDLRKEINGMFRVNTPFRNVSYCQISFGSSFDDDVRKSSFIIEYAPGKKIDISGDYKMNANDILMSMTVKTPCTQLPYSAFTFSHRSDLKESMSHAEMEYAVGQKLSLDTTFSVRNGAQGTLSIRTPFSKEFKGSFSHEGELTNFQTHGEITWGKTHSVDIKYEGNLEQFKNSVRYSHDNSAYMGMVRFALNPTMETEITFETPVKGWETVRMSNSLSGNPLVFSNEAELHISKYGKFAADLSIDLTNVKSVAITVNTPYKKYSSMRVVLTHDGGMRRFQTHAEFQNGQDKIVGDIKLNAVTPVNFEVSLKTPFSAYRSSRFAVTFEGKAYDFTVHTEAQINKATHEVDLIFDYKKKLSIDMAVKSPFTDTIKASLDHYGSWKKFTCKLRIKSGKTKASSDIRFQIKPSFQAFVSIKTPYKMLKNQQFNLKHAGSINNFKCNMKYRCNSKMYIGDMTFQNLNVMKVDMNVKGPEWRPINALILHEGGFSNFKSSADISLGKKKMQASANLNTDNGVKGTVLFSSPIEGFESMKASISHSGPINNFRSHGEAFYNKQSGQVDIEFDSTNGLSSSVSITTPFPGYEAISASVKHTGTIQKFNSHGQFVHNGKETEGQIQFDNGEIVSGSATVKSQFKAIKNVEISFNHEGSRDKFSTHGEMNLNRQRSQVNVMYDSTNGYEGSFNLNSPMVRRIEGSFRHNAGEKIWNTDARIMLGLDEYHIKSDVSGKTSLSANLKIQTPFEGFESTEARAHFDGSKPSFISSAELIFKGDKHSLELHSVISPDVQMKLLATSPLIQDVVVTLEVTGPLSKFESAFDCTYGKTTLLNTALSLQTNGPVKGDFKMTSNLMKNVQASFSHNRRMKDFSTEALFVYAGKKVDGSVSVKFTNDIEATLRLRSPFTKNVEVTFAHYGQLANCRTTGSVVYGGESQVEFSSNLIMKPSIDGEITLRTAVPGYTQFVLKGNHAGILSDFRSHGEASLEGQTITGDIAFSPRRSSFSLSAPMIDNVDAHYTIDGELPTTKAEVQVSYGSSILLEATANINYPDNAEIVIKVPIIGYEKTRLAITNDFTDGYTSNAELELNGTTHRGIVVMNDDNAKLSLKSPMITPTTVRVTYGKRSGAHRYGGEVTYGIDTHAMETEFGMGSKLHGNVLVRSPLMPDLSASFETNMDMKNLETHTKLVYGTKTMLSADLSVDTNKQKFVSANIQIPNNVAKASLSLKGQLSAFKAHGEAFLNRQVGEIDVSFGMKNGLEGKVTLNTPRNTFSGLFTVEGEMTNFKSHFESSLNNKNMEGDISLSLKSDVNGLLKLSYPLNNMELSFSHVGSLRNFESDGKLIFRNQASSVGVMLNLDTATKGELSISTPLSKPLIASFDLTGSIQNLRVVASMEYGLENRVKSEATFSTSPLQGNLEIETSIPEYETLSAAFSHQGHPLDFSNHAEFTVGGKKTETDMMFNVGSKLEGKISVSSPYFPSTSAGFDINGKINNFKAQANFMFREKQYSMDASMNTRSGIDGSITIKTPIQGYKTIVGTLTHTGVFPNFNSLAEIKTGRRNLAVARATFSTANGLIGKMSVQSILTPTLQFNVNHNGDLTAFTSNADIRVNGQSTSISANFKESPSLEGALSLSSPFFRPLSGNFKMTDGPSDFTAKLEGTAGIDTISGEVTSYKNNDAGVTVKIQTPFKGYESMDGTAKYAKSFKELSSSIEFSLAPEQSYEISAEARWNRGMQGSLTMKTPFANLKQSSVTGSYNGAFPNFESGVSVTVAGKTYTVNSELAHSKTISGKLSIETPLAGFENIGLNFNAQGGITDFQTDAQLQYATGKEIVVSVKNAMSVGKLETKAKLECPETDDLILGLSFNGSPVDFTNSLAMSMGSENTLSSTTTFKLETLSGEFESTLTTTLAGYTDEQKILLKYDCPNSDLTASAYGKILGNEYSFDSTIKTASGIAGQFSLKTPINHMKDLAFNFEHKGNLRRFTSKSELQYDTNKKISSEVQYAKYGSRRLQTSLELRTPFRGYENTKLSYRHAASVDSFVCETDMIIMGNDFSGNLRASNAPISATLSITTPFTNYEQIGADMKLTYGSKSSATELNIAYMDGKTISISSEIDIGSSPKIAQIKVSTPFVGYENAEVRLTHNGDLMNFQSVATLSSSFIPSVRAQANVRSSSWRNMDAELVFNSQIKNTEALKFALKNTANRGKYTNHVEASWAPSKSIVFDSAIGKYRDTFTTEIGFTSPFSVARELIIKSVGRKTDTRYFETFSTEYNGRKYVDVDLTVDNALKKMAALHIKSPKDLSFEIGGLASNGMYEGNLVLNKAVYVDGSYDTKMRQAALKYNCPETSIVADATLDIMHPKAEIIVDNARYGFDLSRSPNACRTKLVLPSRSLILDGSMNDKASEGSFMWDADRDETKKIGFRSKLTPARESTKAEMTLMMPSIGKDVQIDSEMILNRGRVMFEGKGELTYSKDMRKKFTVTSRLEDISRSWNSKNYSFSLGISHPYTSVGVQLSSHLAHSDDKLTGGFDLKYQTVKRDTKTFSVNGEINKLMKSVNFDMNTPIKTISIAGNAQMESPYRVSVMNKYDGRRPLRTILSMDPSKRSINFQMNYDQENPINEFHIVAKYDNSSAVSAEVYHVVNRRRITDALASLRLNNSHLLHSRLHWRPAMLNDLKEYTEKKSNSYRAQLRRTMSEVSNEINYEAKQKARLIRDSMMEEMEPLTELMLEQTERFLEMYETNKYHVRDITDAAVASVEDVITAYDKMAVASKKYLRKVSNELKDRASICMEECRKDVEIVLAKVNEVMLQLSERHNHIYKSYSGRLHNMTRHPTVVSLQHKYNDYVTRINAIPVRKHLFSMADKYTSAIYAAHDAINAQMATIMAQNDVRYMKSISDRIVQQGKNAYIYWEIRENTEALVKSIMNWIKSEIAEEISDLKAAIMNIKKTTVTVYDPEHGEIQADIHLPFPLRSLDKAPVVVIAPYINKAKKYIPKVPTFSLPSSDIKTWIPPFDALAMIEGDKVTTFDGLTYNLDGQCTFLLTKDFVDGNFSIGLNNGESRSLTISADGKNIIILADGQVLVDNKVTSLPAVLKNITISAYNNVVTVEGAGNFVVAYNKKINVYAIKLNGWYFGKVSGLLGTYDNEPSNEMITSFGNVKNDAGRFSKSWDIGTARCR